MHQATEGFYVLGSSESSMVLVQEGGFQPSILPKKGNKKSIKIDECSAVVQKSRRILLAKFLCQKSRFVTCMTIRLSLADNVHDNGCN